MNTAILLTSVALLGATPRPDTTVTLRRGDQVQVQDLGGEVRVEVWDRAELEITGEDRSARAVTVSRNGEPGSGGARRTEGKT